MPSFPAFSRFLRRAEYEAVGEQQVAGIVRV